MNVIVVKKNNKEIGRLVPAKKSVLIGRSPVCDLILRSDDMRPLHFLIEWLGEGDFDPRQGMWSLVDISQRNDSSKYVGEAHILQSQGIKVSDFDFSLEKDELAETAVSKGVVSRSMGFEETPNNSVMSSGRLVLELVTYDLKNDVITQVNHFDAKTLVKGLRIASLPKLFFKVEDPNSFKLTIENQGENQLIEHFNRLEKITLLQTPGQKVEISANDFHVLKTTDHAFYIRWVPKVDAIAPLASWMKDPVLMTFMGALVFGVLLSLLVKQVPFNPEEVVPVQRVARVEIASPPPVVPPSEAPAEEVQKQASPPPSQEKPEPPVAVEAAPEVPAEVKPQIAPKEKKVSTAEEVVVKEKPLAQKKAPVQDVNKMGLLGRLKSKSGGSAQVRADQVVNQANPVEAATGEEGTLTINQAPLGKVGLKAKEGNASGKGKASGLESAATTLKTGKVGDAQSVGGISGDQKGKFGTAGNQLGGAGSGEGVGGFGDSGKSNLETGSMEVEGGLTKDDIRKALAENRRAIRNCYERGLLVKKDLQGRLTLKWRISPAGNVTMIGIQNSSLSSPSMDKCVLEIVKGIQFAQAPNKQPTTVIYPFVFQGKN